MASVIALLEPKRIVPGTVLPIDHYLTKDRSFATELSHGGALYLVAPGAAGEIWLVAVLEAPETAGIKVGDRRKPGWYAPPNTTPITDISKLRRTLGLGKDLAASLEVPLVLAPAKDRALREILDDVDAPVIAHVEAQAAPATLDTKTPPLDRAAAHLRSGHVTPAIEAIKEAWRASRVPALADLIDRATRLTPEHDRPLFDKRLLATESEADDIWSATFNANAVAAMPQLLLNLAIGGADHIPKRVRRLVERPEDPRLGARLAELIPAAPNFAPRTYWTPILAVWRASRDARLRDSIGDVQLAGGQGESVEKLVLPTPAPKVSAKDRDPVTAIERELDRLEAPLRTERALVDEIAAHPDDDGPALVYADWLIERGRPLGEYISLAIQQAHGALTPAHARRFAMLVEVPYLCGPFDDLPSIRLRKRDRGIDRDLSANWGTTVRGWRTITASPLVRALRSLRLVGTHKPGRAAPFAELIRAAPALRRIDNIGATTGRQVAAKVDGWTLSDDDLVRR